MRSRGAFGINDLPRWQNDRSRRACYTGYTGLRDLDRSIVSIPLTAKEGQSIRNPKQYPFLRISFQGRIWVAFDSPILWNGFSRACLKSDTGKTEPSKSLKQNLDAEGLQRLIYAHRRFPN